MKRTVIAALMLSLLAGPMAMADPGQGRSYGGHRQRYEAARHYERYRVAEYRRSAPDRAHHWRRGDRLPAAYYARPYRVYDYRRYQLRSPPRGYHWVRVDHDAVLAAIATGIVLDVVLNSFR